MLLGSGSQAETEEGERPFVLVLEVDGPIGPASAQYMIRGMEQGAERGAAAVIIELDTPGGLVSSTRDIIDNILASPVPIATYVSPQGARAASAGTYIMYASHVAAMAPSTTMGAATPIQMGGSVAQESPFPSLEDITDESEGGNGENDGTGEDGETPKPTNPGSLKAVEDAAAYMKALAELRGRNVEWAEAAVREAATVTSSEAVENNIADLRVGSVDKLVEEMDGREVTIGDDRTTTIRTANAEIERSPPDWRDELLALITNPNVAFIFMTLGIYGLIFELSNPGALVPGTLGAIFLLIGLFALNMLPVNYAGLALLVLGIGLMAGEAFAPSFGVLGIGGLASFALGATILFDTDVPGFTISYWTIAGTTALTGAILILLLSYVVRAHRRPAVSGEQTIVGETGIVDSWRGNQGRILVHGEYWNATGPSGLSQGQQVRITAISGLMLTVEPLESASDTANTQSGESG
jgi:membrane-bound serine protease (ClpP class)